MLINETDNPKFAEDDLVWVQVPSPASIKKVGLNDLPFFFLLHLLFFDVQFVNCTPT